MNKSFLFYLVVILFTQTLTGQKQEIKSLEFDKNIRALKLHNFSGTMIAETRSNYYGIHPESLETNWEITKKMSNLDDLENNSFTNYTPIPNSLLVFLENNLINVDNGNILYERDRDSITGMGRYYSFPHIGQQIIEISDKAWVYLIGVEMGSDKELWRIKLKEYKEIKIDNPLAQFRTALPPYLDEANNLVWIDGKKMTYINTKTGKKLWSEDYNPGEVLYSPNGGKMLIVENRSGLGALASAATLSLEKKFGKKFQIVETNSGKELLKKPTKMDDNIKQVKPYEDKFFVIHEGGMNIFSYNSDKGEGLWKKDYDEKGIDGIEIQQDGVMVYFGKKRMLVDIETGKEKWKKPEKLKTRKFRFFDTYSSKPFRFTGSNVIVNKNGKTRTIEADLYDKNDKYVVGAKYIPHTDDDIGINQYSYRVSFINLESLETGARLNDFYEPVTDVEVNEDHFYFGNEYTFLIGKELDGKFNTIKEEKYSKPGEFGRAVSTLGLGILASAAVIGATGSGLVAGGTTGARTAFQSTTALGNQGFKSLDRAWKRTQDGAQVNYAYFFSKDKEKNLVLFQIDKYSGEVVETYEFDDKTPIYAVDEIGQLLYYSNNKVLKIYKLK